MTTDTITLKIDEKGHGYAKIYASLLTDIFQRKRAYASIVALYSLINLIEKTDCEIQNSMTLFRNPMINEQYEISDLYINNYHIDVRVITDGTAVLLPKIHFDNEIQPDYYAVIKVSKDLTNAELLGFANPKKITKEPYDYHYLSCALTELTSYNDFINEIKNKKEENYKEEDHRIFRENYLCLMDNEIKQDVKKELLKHIFNCSECRTEFCCFTGFEMVSSSMSKYPNLLEDQTLEIIGAQAVDSKEYQNKKEETIYFNGDNPTQVEAEINVKEDEESNTQQEEAAVDNAEEEIGNVAETNNIVEEIPEQTVSDILDEIFNEEEGLIETETPEEKPIIQPSIENTTETLENNVKEEIQVIEETLDNEQNEDNIQVIKEVTNEELIEPTINFTEENTEAETILEETSETQAISDDEHTTPEMILEEPQNEQDDLKLIDSDINVTAEEDLVEIIPTEEEVIELEAPTTVQEEIQKVIVDYDEAGEPIYSYITNISSTDTIINNDEISDINLNTEEEFEEYIDEDTNKEIELETETNTEIETKKPAKISDKDIFGDDEEYKTKDTTSEIENIEDGATDDLDTDYETDLDKDYETEENTDSTDPTDVLYNDDEYESEFDEDYDMDENIPDENIAKTSSKKGLFVVLFLIIISLAGFAFWTFKQHKNNGEENNIANTNTPQTEIPNNEQMPTNQNNEQTEDMFGNGIDVPMQQNENQNADNQTTGSIDIPPLTENDLLPPPAQNVQEQNNQNNNAPTINNTNTNDSNTNLANVMASAFSNGTPNLVLRGINWLCNQSLYTEPEFTEYLKKLDSTLRLNIRKNILDVTETPQNNSVEVKFAVDNNGDVLRTMISKSSGSQQVDNIVLQSINETLATEKTVILNNSTQKADKYFVQVVIKL